jgi:type I restriction enzyme S subunit
VRALPPGWAWAKLTELIGADGVFSDGDWVETKDQDASGEVRLTQLADVGEGIFRDRSSRFMTADSAERLGCTYLEPGDVLVARMPDPLGRACLYPGAESRAVTAVDVCILRPGLGGVDNRWLMWWLNTPQVRREVSARQSGTTRKRISRKNLASIQFPLPPLAEQRRIVAAIEEHLSRIDAAFQDLAHAERRLSQFRASALAEAVHSWPERPLGDFSRIFVGTTPSRRRPDLWGGSVPWVSSGEVSFCRINATRESIAAEAVSAERVHPPGTVLLAMIGEGRTRGQAALLDVAAAHNQNSAAIRLDATVCAPEWLFYVFMARYEQVRAVGSGGQQPALNSSRVAALGIPLPPLREQRALVDLIEQRLSRATALELSVRAARQRASALQKSLLARAFRGDLVPRDPNDEPASILLERIAAERAAAPKTARRRATMAGR